MPECRNAPDPNVMIWGDSIAMAAVPGLASAPDSRIVQVTRAFCGPLLDRSPLSTEIFDETWARGCRSFNRSVIDALHTMPSVRTVVLSSSFDQYLDPEREVLLGSDKIMPARLTDAVSSLTATVLAVRLTGKRVVLLARPPASNFDIGMCAEHAATGRLILRKHDCRFPLADEEGGNLRVKQLLQLVSQRANVSVVSFDDLLCHEGWCTGAQDGVPIYFDGGHLSASGSRWAARRLDLLARLQREAR